MYLLFYIAGWEIISCRISKSASKLLLSSFQSGIYLPIERFNDADRETLHDISNIYSSNSFQKPLYIDMLKRYHYQRVVKVINTSQPKELYPEEFYKFLSQHWTNLGCDKILYPNGFHIPIFNKTLKAGLIENMYLYCLNHHELLRPFLSANSSYFSRGDHRNLFIATYSVVFFV